MDNLEMGFLHRIQGVLMIVISNDKTFPIFANYLNFGERVYTILSLASKPVICWLIWTGTLAPV